MYSTKRYTILGFLFLILFGFGFWLLERIEGNKITTTEHVDFGLNLIWIGALYGFLIYILLILPLTILIERFFNKSLFKLFIFTFIGFFTGKIIFEKLFSFFIERYNLTDLSSIAIFTIISLLYGIADIYTKRLQ
ncbi:hypothetical protein [Bacillus sp. Hm123]|uniref:hypothetical protein n=1 Tax=Bacillus sp. Hm123 TaxID=3450745 RepID=UPI003F41E1A8